MYVKRLFVYTLFIKLDITLDLLQHHDGIEMGAKHVSSLALASPFNNVGDIAFLNKVIISLLILTKEDVRGINMSRTKSEKTTTTN